MYIPSRHILIGMIVFISLNKMAGCAPPPPAASVGQGLTSSPVSNQRSAIVAPDGWKKIDADGKVHLLPAA